MALLPYPSNSSPFHSFYSVSPFSGQFSGVYDSHHKHNDKHEPSIKNLQRNFFTEQPAMITLLELSDFDEVSDQEESAGKVKIPKNHPPR